MISPGTPRIQSSSGTMRLASLCPEACAGHGHNDLLARRVDAAIEIAEPSIAHNTDAGPRAGPVSRIPTRVANARDGT
jgi:hypothetical protein